ncbi:hypothetical protein [Psittacicella hinzii]|uniref:DUF4919 domain-containing protein n=1 Tax=Psittacicella hinzii TaxID=2028575 RepID=A0A3A1YMH4_9GAMM|nr:hypothetical protein [Psittacicella hinzii]RIY38751.1 hypothetical protein CKF58_03480 [Psittacicella hinzii]
MFSRYTCTKLGLSLMLGLGVLNLATPSVAAPSASSLEKELDMLLKNNADFITVADHWISLLNSVYRGKTIPAKELSEYTSYYFSVINKKYKLENNKYSSESVDNFVRLFLACTQYSEVGRNSKNFSLYSKPCYLVRTVAAGGAFNADALQTLALLALRDDLQEKQAPSAKDKAQLQMLLNLDNLKTPFNIRYLGYQDYANYNLDDFFFKVYQVTIKK